MQLESFTHQCNTNDSQTHATWVIHTNMQLDMQLNMQLERFTHRCQSNDLHIDATQHATGVFHKYMQLEWMADGRNSTWNSRDSHIYATHVHLIFVCDVTHMTDTHAWGTHTRYCGVRHISESVTQTSTSSISFVLVCHQTRTNVCHHASTPIHRIDVSFMSHT